ncbi:MAG: glutaminase [Solirubrobacteraceae bacterium]|nr:glutaminase [Solirubrobacteraceae bacterium]
MGRHVDVEPTGVSFDAIGLHPVSGLPYNPMINAGAISVVSLFDDLPSILDGYSRFAGRRLEPDEDLWAAELAVNHRNRAIAHLLKGSGALGGDDPERALSLYLGQCTAHVDTRDLAMIAATLANGGVNPATGERAAGDETVRGVLSVMTSCGMYDGAGQWLFTVGMPAKSGVAGSIIAVLPGRFGLAVYSPPLDAHGNSIRGLAVCRDLSDDMALHMIESGRRGPSPVRARYTLRERTSKRVRSPEAQGQLAEAGDQAVVVELQGELLFSEAEFVTREVALLGDEVRVVVLDFRRVRRVLGAVPGLIADLHAELAAAGTALVLSSVGRHTGLRDIGPPVFPELDLALEHCEAALLPDLEPRHVPLAGHELLAGLPEAAVARLRAGMEHRRHRAGELVLRRDDPADELLLIISGELSVLLATEDGDVRVGTLSAGMLAGEMALLTEERRSGDVRADTDVEAYALTGAQLAGLRDSDPALQAAVLENLVRILSRRAQAMRDELALAVE